MHTQISTLRNTMNKIIMALQEIAHTMTLKKLKHTTEKALQKLYTPISILVTQGRITTH